MPVATDRLEFAPPPQPGLVRAGVLAVIAHLLLMAALTWGIRWNRDIENLAAEAELWSPTVEQAAPRAVEAPPPPPPPPPVIKEQPASPPPGPTEAQIAVEREKKRLAEEKKREQELERQKKLAEQKKLDEQKKQEQARKAADERRREEQAKRQEELRQENIRRMQGLANATGSPSASGTAARSSGPTSSYAGRIRARVRPNIVFTDDIAGNPTAEVEVRMAPDGTITSKRIVKSSGAKSWDDAVLRALDRTEVLPRDVDGRVHTPLVIEFRPKG